MSTAIRIFDCYCIVQIWTNKHINLVLVKKRKKKKRGDVIVRSHSSVRLIQNESGQQPW